MKRVLVSLEWVLVGCLAISLPFTSFPLISKFTGSSMVAPLSLLPLGLLVVVWFLPHLLKKGRLPAQAAPLLAFVLAALLSTCLAFFLPFPPFKGLSLLSNEIKALATLLIGLCFYLVIAGWTNKPERICFLLRFINWSGVIVLGWSLFQAAVYYRTHTYPDWMWNFQAAMDSSQLLYGQRANGFAYEPSWLAHQLNMLYLPFWLAATVSGFSAHRFHVGKIHFENLLLLGGIAALVLSVSRVGMLAFMLMVAFLLVILNIRLVRWLQNRFLPKEQDAVHSRRAARRWFAAASVLVLVLVYFGLLLGVGYGLSRYDARMAKLFDFGVLKEKSFMQYANQLVFAERLVFWQVGWEVFNDYPIMGVGLGNVGFFFTEKLSIFSWNLTEIRVLMYHSSNLPNTKSLWVRLLSETGIVGFALFLSWCYVLWQSAQFLRHGRVPWARMVGLAGSFALIGLLIEGFSLDTFALPYNWITFGIVTAACEFTRRSLAVSPGAPAP